MLLKLQIFGKPLHSVLHIYFCMFRGSTNEKNESFYFKGK